MGGVLNLLLAGAASAIKDAYFNLTTLLLNTSSTNGAQNNTFLDSSTNNFAITRNGNTTQGTFTPFSQTGWSNYFNGSSNLATVSNPNLAFGTGDITCEFWMNTFSNSDNGLFGTTNEAAWNSNSWSFKYSASAIVLYNGNSGGDLWSISTGTLHDGAWHHVAIVRSSGTWQVFVDGVSKGTTTTQGTRSLGDNSWRFAVGSIEPSNSDLKYTGYLSNFRLNNTALYSSNFTPSTTPLTAVTGTKLLTCQSNRFLDNSSSAIALTVGSAPSVQAFSPFLPTAAYSTSVVGGSGYFDGTGDSLTTPSSANLAIGTSDFCIEWFYYQTNSATSATPLSQWGGSNNDWILQYNSSNFIFYYASSSIGYAYTPVPNQWTHACVCRSGSTMSLYLNGVRVNTKTDSTSIPNTRGLTVGANPDTSSQDCTGYISNARIVVGSSVYNPSSTTLTVPTAPLTAVTGTKFLLSSTNAGIYDSASKNVLETVGNAQVSTTQAKWGTTSMYFDGSGDYLYTPNACLPNSGDFTLEMWIYPTSTAGYQLIYSQYTSGSSGGNFELLWDEFNEKFNVNFRGSTLLTSSSTYSLNVWHHLAIVRSGSTFTMYVDGASAATATNSDTILQTASYVGTRSLFDSFFSGYIDDLRITRGYARYSGSTYTVPAAAFPLQ